MYSWHRWISHAGLLRCVGKDVFRRRHFHHHFRQYPSQRLRANGYVASCDITFGLVEVLLVIGAAAAGSTTVAPIPITAAAVAGIALHGLLSTKVHELCHAADVASPRWPLRQPVFGSALEYLRVFHDGHHTGRGNYSLLVPMIDIVGRTRIVPEANSDIAPDVLFPRFREELSSSCADPLL